MTSLSESSGSRRLGIAPTDPAVLPPRRQGHPDDRRRPRAPRHNLPHLPSGFVGRREEIAEIRELLTRSRLVTVTGAGGMGKTHLCLQVATAAASAYPDGVWLAELAVLPGPAGLSSLVAAALPWRDQRTGPGAAGPETPEDVARQIGDHRMLLVLDNCEHLVAACAHLAELVLRSCPGLVILATSRERLGIIGEQTWSVGPLSLPDPDKANVKSLKASEAGQLFLQRAMASSPGFGYTQASVPVVAQICRRLDGMPLAIEMAAARLPSMSAAEILQRLSDPIALLNSGSRTVMPRHQTLGASLEWSHDLLTPPQAILLRRLSVFAGWTLEAAERVCDGDEVKKAEVVDHLASLVDKSLVVVEARGERVRYRLLETVRLWARAKLDEAPEGPAILRRHATWCMVLAEGADEETGGSAAGRWLDQLDAEHGNLRAALEWARSAAEAEIGVRLATALVSYWRARGHIEEGVRWLEWAVLAAERCPVALQARALRGAGVLQGLVGDIASALPLLERSSALSAGSEHEDAGVCNCNPMTRMFRNPRQALPALEERIEFCRRTGDTKGLAHLFFTTGQAHFVLAEAAEARLHFEECVRLGREESDGEALRSGLFGLGRVALLLGDYPTTEVNASEARALAERDGDLEDTATSLQLLGDLARARGEWDRARDLLRHGERLARAVGAPASVARALYLSALLAQWESSQGADEISALFEKSLTLGRAAGAPGFHETRCLIGMGWATQAGGDPTSAAGYFLDALEKAQALGDQQATAHAFDHLSILARLQGKGDDASMMAHRGLVLHHRIGELAAVASSLELLAGLAGDAGRGELTARLLGAAQAIRDSHGYARSRWEQAQHDAGVAELRSNLGEAAFTATWAEGAAASVEEAVGYAVRGRGARDRPASGWGSLTPAERDVVRLVAQGLTNPEVGRRLFISPRTVGHHLSHVYDKVNIRSRGALIKALAGLEV